MHVGIRGRERGGKMLPTVQKLLQFDFWNYSHYYLIRYKIKLKQRRSLEGNIVGKMRKKQKI